MVLNISYPEKKPVNLPAYVVSNFFIVLFLYENPPIPHLPKGGKGGFSYFVVTTSHRGLGIMRRV